MGGVEGRAMVRQLEANEAVRWVTEYLGKYCPPGEHRYAVASRSLRWCTLCFKEELRDGGTCLICDLHGESAGDLTRDGVQQAHGQLCADCELGLVAGRTNGLAPWLFSRDN
jgi:hypothetical protein